MHYHEGMSSSTSGEKQENKPSAWKNNPNTKAWKSDFGNLFGHNKDFNTKNINKCTSFLSSKLQTWTFVHTQKNTTHASNMTNGNEYENGPH